MLKNLGSDSHEMTEPALPSQEDNLDRNNIRRLVMVDSTFAKYMYAVRLVRILQIALGPILIAINAVLLVRYMSLQRSCPADSDEDDCEIYRKAVGAFKYCVVPGIIGIVQAVWCLAATFKDPLPLHTVVGADNMAAGFYMGGGCVSKLCPRNHHCEARLMIFVDTCSHFEWLGLRSRQ